MKSLSRGRRDYGTVPTALPLMPPSGTLLRRQFASFPSPSSVSARETRSALSIPRFYHLELVRLSANDDGPTTAASSRSKIVSVPPAMHFPEFLRSVARVLRVDPTVVLRITHKERPIESLPALHSVPAGALLQIGMMPGLQRRHQRQQQPGREKPSGAGVQRTFDSARRGYALAGRVGGRWHRPRVETAAQKAEEKTATAAETAKGTRGGGC